MTLRSWVTLISCLLIALGCGLYAYKVFAQQNDRIELTKDEAVQLLSLQYQLESTMQARDRYVTQLYTKYFLSQTEYQLDVSTGGFVIKTKPKGK